MKSSLIKQIAISSSAKQSIFSQIKIILKRSVSIILAIVFVGNYCCEAQAENAKYKLKSKSNSGSTKSKKAKNPNIKTLKKSKKTKQKNSSIKNKKLQIKKSTTPEIIEVPRVGVVEKTRIIN